MLDHLLREMSNLYELVIPNETPTLCKNNQYPSTQDHIIETLKESQDPSGH